MRKLKAGVIDAALGHKFSRCLYRIIDSFELRCRIAVTSGSRILIVQPINVSRNKVAGVVVRLRFDDLGNVVGGSNDTTGGDYTIETGIEDGALL